MGQNVRQLNLMSKKLIVVEMRMPRWISEN